jgi:hypothetical protein
LSPAFLLFLFLCFSAFPASPLFDFPACLLFCFFAFPAFPASLPFLLLCFSAYLLFLLLSSLLLCFSAFCFSFFSAFLLLCLSTSTFPFLQSCVFAALFLPAPLLLCFLFTVSLLFFFLCFILSCLYP